MRNRDHPLDASWHRARNRPLSLKERDIKTPKSALVHARESVRSQLVEFVVRHVVAVVLALHEYRRGFVMQAEPVEEAGRCDVRERDVDPLTTAVDQILALRHSQRRVEQRRKQRLDGSRGSRFRGVTAGFHLEGPGPAARPSWLAGLM